jgi:serine/threonine-protein kinase
VGAARAVHFLRQACHSLGEAHEVGLIHRDIKPANIFTCRLGPDYDFVKVLDFGLVKQQADGDQATATELTGVGVTAGTPAYMAPEMAMSRPEVDARADIYALGCVAYWLVTGHQVFSAQTPVAAILHHVRTPPVPPSQRASTPIPESLERVIMSCLAKDPAGRPRSAYELSELLRLSLNGEGWTAAQAREWWDAHEPSTVTSASGEAFAVVRPKR